MAATDGTTARIDTTMILRQGAGLVIGGAIVTALILRAPAPDIPAILSAARATQPWQWAMALALSCLSFLAVGRYDAAVHGQLRTGVAPGRARRSGMAAIALSQTTGAGLIVGALVRWRCLPELDLKQALAVTATVAGGFLGGLAVIGAALVLLSDIGALRGVALAILAVFAVFCFASLLARRRLPALPLIAGIVALVALDMAAAGAALAVFMPTDIPLLTTIAAFTLAMGAGLVSGTPGGIGAFEVTLIAVLPTGAGAEPLLCAVLCFRVVYYALPALLAATAVLTLRRAMGAMAAPPMAKRLCSPLRAARAEAGLIHTPGALALTRGDGAPLAMVRRTPQALVSVGDGFAGPLPLATLQATARIEGRTACAYKIGARDALCARARGWAVWRTGREALIDPALFDLDGPAHRQLRRKLRRAEKAGVTIARVRTPLPLADMARLDADWCAAHGGARGFSMGRFDPACLARQEIWIARRDGAPVAFLSLHMAARERTLDLMRHGDAAPDGTMHLLLASAIAAARDDGIA